MQRTVYFFCVLLGWISPIALAQNGQNLLNTGRYPEARGVFENSLQGLNSEGYFETYIQEGNHEAGL